MDTYCFSHQLVQELQLLRKMKPIFVLVLVLASDLCNAKESEEIFRDYPNEYPGGPRNLFHSNDYELGGLLGDADLIKSMIPTNMDEAFEIAEEIVPGMKDLEAPVEKTWKLLHPVLKVNLQFSKK